MRIKLSALAMAAILGTLSPLASADLYEGPIYGAQFMTEEEIREYRKERGALEDPEACYRYDQDHYQMIQERIQARGADLLDDWAARSEAAGRPEDMGKYTLTWSLMEPEERTNHLAYLRSLPTAKERMDYIVRVHEFVQARAELRGALPPEFEQAQEPIYGAMLMTEEERNAYRGLLAVLPPEERKQQQAYHREMIQERARALGSGLADWAGRSETEGRVAEEDLGKMMYYWTRMDDAEHAKHVEKLRQLSTTQERIAYIRKQYEQVKARLEEE